MKKTYIIPEMTAVYTAQTLLDPTSTSTSQPKATINHSGYVEAASVEVKGKSQDYDVWDDDWQK